MKGVFCQAAAMFCALTLAACSSSSPAQPSGASAGASSVIAPRPLTPNNASTIRNADQPIVLTVNNGFVTGNAGATYTFEIATDSGFSNKVQVKDGVPEGSSGQTSVRLDALAASTDYYWHARAQGGGTTGLFSPVYKFTVGPAILLQAPTPISPANGATTAGWPTFTVSNAARSGPVGAITYRFDIATNAGFSPVLLSGTAAEGVNVTSYTPPAGTAAPSTKTLYWRAVALDQTNGVSGPSTAAWTFTYIDGTFAVRVAAQEGQVLWPGVQPTGTGGHISIGGGWDIQNATTNGITRVSPALDELRVLDLLDRGMDPYSAIAWLNANGYGTSGAYYPAIGVIGFPLDYMESSTGAWALVVPGSRG